MVTVMGSAITGLERNTEKANNITITIENQKENFFIDLSPYFWVITLKCEYILRKSKLYAKYITICNYIIYL
jgi:hypothetical protein